MSSPSARCHLDIAQGADILRPRMAVCGSCHDHAAELAGNACDRCHVDLRAEGVTPSDHLIHDGNFLRERGLPCHRAHGPNAPSGPPGPASVPDCLSCHASAKLGGLHAAPGHTTCTSCHAAHSPPSGARATCLGCHSDRRDHEPNAAVCSGCHGFAKPR